MVKRTRGKFILLLFVSALVALVLGWWLAPRNGLLTHAALLVPRSQWMGPERQNGDIGNYTWLNPEEVLLFERGPLGTILPIRKRVTPPGTVGAAATLPVPPLQPPLIVSLSPSGDTLLVIYKRVARALSRRSEFISLRDGRSYGIQTKWPLGTWDEAHACVCEFEYRKTMIATLHYFNGRKEKEITVEGAKDAPVMQGNVWPLFIEASGRTVAIGDSYYEGIVTPADRVRLGSNLSPVRTLVEFNLSEPQKKARVWTVSVPFDAATFLCMVSPRHDRLLWIVQSNRMPLLASLTQKLPRPFKRPPSYLCRWMVSDLDGRNMHSIAEFEISDLHFKRPDLLMPQWNPDGKHISFEYDGALYWLPAD